MAGMPAPSLSIDTTRASAADAATDCVLLITDSEVGRDKNRDTRGVKPGRFQANRVQLALRQICMQLFALEPNLEDSVAGAAGFEPANAGTKNHIAPDPAHRKPQISAGSAILRCSRIGSNKNRDTNRDTRTRSPSLVRRRERLRAFSSKDAELFPVEVRGFRRIRGRPGLEQLPNADGEQRRHEHRQHASPP